MRATRPRTPRQLGQASLEYAGVVVLLAAVGAALSSSSLGQHVVDSLRCAAGRIAGNEAEACAGTHEEGRANGTPTMTQPTRKVESTPPNTSNEPIDGPKDGPPIGQRTNATFDQQYDLSFYCGLTGRSCVEFIKEHKGYEGNVGVDVKLDSSKKISGPQPKTVRVDTDGDGRPDDTRLTQQVTLQTVSRLELSVTGGVEKGNVELSLNGATGQKTTYEIKVNRRQAKKIQNEQIEVPNPVDPYSIPKNGSIVLTKEDYTKHGMAAQYRLLRGSTSHTDGSRVATGIKRTGKHEVTIFVGDEAFVRNTLAVGLGVDGLNGKLKSTSTQSEGRMTRVKLDLSTREGREKYRHFLETGKLPSRSGGGVTDVAQVKTIKATDVLSAEATVGPIESKATVNKTTTEARKITHADGSETRTFTYHPGDVTYTVTADYDKKGRRTDTRYSITLNDVEPRTATQYQRISGHKSVDYNKKKDISITFTKDQLKRMQQQSYEMIASRCRRGEHISGRCPEEPGRVEEYFHSTKNVMLPSTFPGLSQEIADAENPDEVFAALYSGRTADGSSTDLMHDLMRRAVNSNSSTDKEGFRDELTPGEVTVDDES